MSTLDDAKAYIGARFGARYTNWMALVDADMTKTLVSAGSFLDTLPWQGTATGVAIGSPALASWPRSGIDGVDSTTVPIAVTDAWFELATFVLANADIVNKVDQGSNIQGVQGGGGVGVTFFAPTSVAFGTATVLPPLIERMVGKYLATPAEDGSFGASGKACSAFRHDRQFTLGWPED